MNLKEYSDFIFEQIKVDAVAEETSIRESFFKNYTDILMDGEEIEDFEYLPFEGIGKNRRKIQIDGYSYNELDEVLSLFIAPTLTNFDEVVFTASEAEKHFNRAIAFIEDSDIILQNAEESAPGFELAREINKKFKNVKKYRIYLLTDMQMSKQIQQLNHEKVNAKTVEYHIWDIDRIFKIAESGSVKEDVVIDLKDYKELGIPCLVASKTEDYEAYLCNIPGILLAKLYNQYGGRLLEGNVRSFLQAKGKVNKGIRNTILNNPTMFFAYNNGIAATASDIKLDCVNGITYITEITALQIVNGGQTTASLAMSLLNDRKDNSEEKIEQIFVPMKLSVVNYEKTIELIPNISRFANSQNKVSDSDLWSNHPFHIRMEDFSRRLSAPAINGKQYGTKWYYERANGQYAQQTYKSTEGERTRFEMVNPKNQMFKKTELAKFINIFDMLPHVASAGGQMSFTKFAESISKQWDKDNTEFNEEYFRKVVSIAILFKETDKLVKTQDWFKSSYKANIIAYTISKIIYTVKKDYPERVISYKNIWQNQKLSVAWIKQIENISEIIYNHLTDENRGIENVTEWAKREECWAQAMQLNVKLLPAFVNELVYLKSEEELKNDAKADQRLANNIDYMVQVANFGVDNWKYLLNWGGERNLFSPIEQSFIKSTFGIEKGKFPSEKQCKFLISILNKARNESFPK